MSENKTVISRRPPPNSASSGMLEKLIVNVPRNISAEQAFDFSLFSILDEVVICGAGKEGEPPSPAMAAPGLPMIRRER